MGTYPFGIFVRVRKRYAHAVTPNMRESEGNSMTDLRKPEEIAVNRHKIIAPILVAMEEKADAAKIVLLKKEAYEQ